MAFQISPGVNVSEIDLTTVVPAVQTTTGAISGVFGWGPVDQTVLVDSEVNLARIYGKPSNYNAETWFTAANFLGYGNSLYINRIANTTSTGNGAISAIASNTGTTAEVTNYQTYGVKNADDYDAKTFTDTDLLYVARYPGLLGNSLKISQCSSANQYLSALTIANAQFVVGTSVANLTFTDGVASAAAQASYTNGSILEVGNTTIGKQYLKIANSAVDGANISFNFYDKYSLSTDYGNITTINRYWEFYNLINRAPGQSQYVTSFGNTAANDELHVVVVDEDGKFTGSPGAVLEVYEGLSRATDAKTIDGASNYYKTVINDTSNYVWWANARTGSASNTANNIASATNGVPLSVSFVGGLDGDAEDVVSFALLAQGYDKFASAETIDVSLLLQGKARGSANGSQLAAYLIDNIAEKRKDCVVFTSPEKADVVANSGDKLADVLGFQSGLNRSSSYAVMDSGYKYQYDKYNDIYRWIPLNGDIAGLCVRTDEVADVWYSPGGFNRGQIKNVVKLAWNPAQAERDKLYKNNVNPVVSFPGQGTVLFGDKTLLAKPSAFDRINVRRLFITLEKAIATASKFTLFEFNDEFTRAQFVGLIEPYLRAIQGRRGITDYKVVCDSTNNTGQVIDSNQFVGDIYIKPARSINFIQLNFVAVRSGVEFNEVIGSF